MLRTIVALLGACLVMPAHSRPQDGVASLAYAAPPEHIMVSHLIVEHGDARLEVLAQGKGPTIVMLPSLGRGASDFDAIADQLAGAGFPVLRPEPRGIGKSTGPWQGGKLEDPAAHIAAAIEQHKNGPASM